jgi:carbonic anhydrase
MQKLIQGIHKFQAEIFRSKSGLFRSLAQGQSPEFLFVTCCDSRIVPHLLTQTDPGDLFILRNIGNVIPPHGWGESGAEAAVEYAVAALKVKHIVVCGHSHCGAMKGLLHPEELGAMPSVAAWLVHAQRTRQIVEQNYRHLQGEALLDATIQENVLVQLEHLSELPSVKPRLEQGLVQVHGWVYKFETGEVFAYTPESDQFLPSKEAYATSR